MRPAIYERVERAYPEAVDAAYFLALIDLVRERPVAALDRLLKLSRRMPGSFDVWQALAHTRRTLGQWPESVTASRRALDLRPTDAHERFELADALEVVGRLDEAVQLICASWPRIRPPGLNGPGADRPSCGPPNSARTKRTRSPPRPRRRRRTWPGGAPAASASAKSSNARAATTRRSRPSPPPPG